MHSSELEEEQPKNCLLNLLSLHVFKTVFHQLTFLCRRWHDRATATCWVLWKETRRRINEHTLRSDLLLAIKQCNMDCCTSCRCLLAFKIAFLKANFLRPSHFSCCSICANAGWKDCFIGSGFDFQFGATELRTFAPKTFPRTDFFFNLPRRKVMIYFCQKGKKKKNKKMRGHRARFRDHELHFFKIALF